MAPDQLQMFGGDWTEQKLSILKDYLSSYCTALKNQPFQKLYIDAFAGTGYREEKSDSSEGSALFGEVSDAEPQRFLAGSALIALQSDPAFDRFIFVEKSRTRADELQKLRNAPEHSDRDVTVIVQDSNQAIVELCWTTNWRSSRAVLFLDPFGMQVNWTTIEAIASTKAIDLWVLFPLGMAANRLLARSIDRIDAAWRRRLDAFFGTTEWEQRFYSSVQTPSLTGVTEERRRRGTIEEIGAFYWERLASLFPRVAKNPAYLRNSNGMILFQLHFAAANPKGAPLAMRIAEHLLKRV